MFVERGIDEPGTACASEAEGKERGQRERTEREREREREREIRFRELFTTRKQQKSMMMMAKIEKYRMKVSMKYIHHIIYTAVASSMMSYVLCDRNL